MSVVRRVCNTFNTKDGRQSWIRNQVHSKLQVTLFLISLQCLLCSIMNNGSVHSNDGYCIHCCYSHDLAKNMIGWKTWKNYFLRLAYLQILHSSGSPRGMQCLGDWMIPSSVDGHSQSFTTLLVKPAVANIPSAPTYATRFNTAFFWIEWKYKLQIKWNLVHPNRVCLSSPHSTTAHLHMSISAWIHKKSIYTSAKTVRLI